MKNQFSLLSIGPLEVVFRLPTKPNHILLQPEGKAVLTVPSVPIYSIFVVE